MDQKAISLAVSQILKAIGCDPKDPNFVDTPDRVARAYSEIFAGMDHNIDWQIAEILSSTFPCQHQQVVVANNIEVFSCCPHHLLPVHYRIAVGYMPGDGEDAKVLGLSKLCRIVNLLAARPVLQEQMVNDITQTLMRIPGCKGAGCVTHGEHYCMRMRGVKQSGSVVITSSLKGEFLTDTMVRSEFLDLVR